MSPREVPGFATAGAALRVASPNVSGDWYCRACGYLSSTRVTNAETCDTCHQPVEWHTADQQTALEVAEQKIAALTAAVTAAKPILESVAPDGGQDPDPEVMAAIRLVNTALRATGAFAQEAGR